ncbi:MAG: hypothetical protein GQ574_01220 [Crocinitomix sp.]|nr:hypothetical protein [Crocinitomix sp.]
MRKELEIIEQIENFLMNKLSGSEKTAFEAKIAADAGLKSEVDFQQDLVEGIQRMGLKSDTIKARKKYRTQRFLKATGITFVIIAAIAAAAFYYTKNTEGAWSFLSSNEPTIETNSENVVEEVALIVIDANDTLSSEANAYLDQELFEIKTDRDTVIESEEGIVVFIPANAFETENDQVDFLIQEALTPADILYAGLNTMTDDGEELETGGMFYFDAFADGERVPLQKELTVDIPANPDKTGMQLYDGIENEAGEILWTNPKPFTKPLVPVEITELDFYPKGYEPQLEKWGYLNKQFKDSLYYSYADECGEGNTYLEEVVVDDAYLLGKRLFEMNCASCHFPDKDMTGPALKGSRKRWIDNSSEENFYAFIKNSPAAIESGDPYANEISSFDASLMSPQAVDNQSIDWIFEYIERFEISQSNAMSNVLQVDTLDASDALLGDIGDIDCVECGVNPASVKTIWNSKFNNTNLATKEFEARMPFIHQTCNNSILELYVNNLDKNLCTIDSMAMRRLSGSNRKAFSNFALKGQGQVTVTTSAQQSLNAYYALKKQALQRAITKTNAAFWAEENRQNAEMNRKDQEARNRNSESNRRLNKQEIEFNTREVYAQLGMRKPRPRLTNPIVFNSTTSSSNFAVAPIIATDPIIETPAWPTTPINPNRTFLRTNIRSTGWKNVDCLMSLSTIRENAKIRGANGRTATVKYSKMTVTVADASNYDRLNVYAVSNKFNSYIKLTSNKGNFEYKLNDKLSYSVIAIAWNSDGMFYKNIDGAPGTSAIQLSPITKAEWEGEIKANLGNINSMTDELNYLEYAKKDQNRKNKNSAKRNLRNKARPYVFPCKCSADVNDETEAVDPLLNEAVVFNDDIIVNQANNGNVADLIEPSSLRLLNAFTPNGDGKNDFFGAIYANLSSFAIIIYEENGKSIFGSEDANFRWRGKDKSGNQMANGSYAYEVTAIGMDGVDYSRTGAVIIKGVNKPE